MTYLFIYDKGINWDFISRKSLSIHQLYVTLLVCTKFNAYDCVSVQTIKCNFGVV